MGNKKKKREKVILPPQLPPEVADEEVQVSDEDINFVRENRAYAGFLKKLDTKSIDRHVTRVADKTEDELEALYEKRKRKAMLLKEEEGRLRVDPIDALPVKTLSGELQYRTRDSKELKSQDSGNGNESATGVEDSDKYVGGVKLTKAERRLKLKKRKKEAKKLVRQEEKPDDVVDKENLHSDVLAKVEEDLSTEELFRRKKIKLAEVGLKLMEDPEANIKILKELLQICVDKDKNIVKLSLMSLLAVFKDIIPSYRIRLPTEKELQMTVSKAVRQARIFESTLLKYYKAYLLQLKHLEKHPDFHQVVVRCFCSLLEAVPHFNFRESILVAVVKNISSMDDTIRRLCCCAVRSLFLNEGKHDGEATLEAVRLIASIVKSHDCQLHPDSIDVFLSLSFDEDIGKSNSNYEETTKPKRNRKWKNHDRSKQLQPGDMNRSRQEAVEKTGDEVTTDLKSVSFAMDSKEKRRVQSETLAAVFETYFRVLKSSTSPTVGSASTTISASGGSLSHPLLAPCLKGLGKFSHLIDLDFMGDLMQSLKRLAGHSNDYAGSSQSHLSVSERLQCCIVAFKVMRNNLDALNVDLQDFFIQLYNLLLEYRPDRDRGEVLAEALKIMLCEGKHHDMQRAAAFIKRLGTFCLSMGSAEALAALVTVKHLLQKNSLCHGMLENDGGGGLLSGLVAKYQPDAVDPNLSGALASVLWELGLLMKHYNPSISSMALSISSMASMNPAHSQVYLSTVNPMQAFSELSIEKELYKLAAKPGALNRKRKRESENNFVLMDPNQVKLDNLLNEDDVKRKLEDHFMIHKGIKENEKLRRELNDTLSTINLYKEYKSQKKQKRSSKKSTKRHIKVLRPNYLSH